jgi:nicotinate dehydrogenase subunit B
VSDRRYSRRAVLKGIGSITIAFSLAPSARAADAAKPSLGSLSAIRNLDAWLRIDAHGEATVFTGKVELGQGILTALWQIAAEELDLPLARVRMTSVDTHQSPNEGFTAGSQSIESSGAALRMAAAEARAILVEHAAQRLGLDVAALRVADGVITSSDGREVAYGELAAHANLRRAVSGAARPKPASEHRIVGQSTPRLDILAKVTGEPAFVQDMRLPGMLHGRVVRPPRYDATLQEVDEAIVKSLPGIVAVVRDGSFLGVIAEREEQAIKAGATLAKHSRWSGGRDLPEPATTLEYLRARSSETSVTSEPPLPTRVGVRLVQATYTKPYISHASIGPSCALAHFSGGRFDVWSHAQGPFPLRADLARVLKVPQDAIRCVHAQGSGCYGHNGADDAALDAALLARAVPDRPVRVQWDREDEFAWSPYGCAMTVRLTGLLDDAKIVGWDCELWSNTHSTRPGQSSGANLLASWHLADPFRPGEPGNIPMRFGGGSERNAKPPYDVPGIRIVNHLVRDMPLRVSALRTLGAYANVFAAESFMDELAAAARADPIAFRLAHLTDPRARAVVEKVAAMAGWKPNEVGTFKRGRGLGFARYKNAACYVAVIAEATVDARSGEVRIPRIWAAADAGLVINPDGLRNQIEGGIVQSMSWTLFEQVRFDRHGIQSRDWASYPILTMSGAPNVSVELINRPDEPSLGAGEAAGGPTAAAIGNALARALGKRIRGLPLDAARVRAALA